MSKDPVDRVDRIRERWVTARAREGLVDTSAADFAGGGLARLLPDRSPRLLILPVDPERHLVEFDEDFWAWWMSDEDDPATGRQTSWGSRKRPSAFTAVIGVDHGQGKWSRYIALHHSGALELGFGRDGAFEREDRRFFFLSPIVARSWSALSRYARVIERFSLEPPYEVTLALPSTEGALLAGFAEGWAEPGSFEYTTDPGPEGSVLIRRELDAWPDGPGVKDVSFSLGAQIEDTWGVPQRRFLANRGEYVDSFDPRTARWDA
jgi:hypothetical protein